MAARFTVSEEVRDVLRRSTVIDRTLRLPEQLDRKLYLAVDKVLKGAGGKWLRHQAVHVFDRDPREVLELAVDHGKGVNVQQELGAFYTPDAIADQLVAIAEIDSGSPFCLEPSAGEGSLLRATWRRNFGARFECYDVDPFAVEKLNALCVDQGSSVVHRPARDFLTTTPAPVFDRVITNPPFSKDADAKHVLHAWQFLKPGGVLVAIVSAAATTRTRGVEAQAFADLYTKNGTRFELVAEGAFKESGTNVRTMIVKLVKR